MSRKKDYQEAKDKVAAYKTVKDLKKQEALKKKQDALDNFNQKKEDQKKQLNELKSKGKEKLNDLKTNAKNQLEELLEIYKQVLPDLGPSNGSSTLSKIFIEACENTKVRILDILIEEMVSSIGCSEEQNYPTNVPIYIKVNQTDLFNILKDGPDGGFSKFFYEKKETQNGTIPYSMNRELFKRLQSSQSFLQEYGQKYIGSSGRELFDVQYVQSYVDSLGANQVGDFFKVTMSTQSNGGISITTFLYDYFTSIELFNIEDIGTNLLNFLTGALSFSLGSSKEELTQNEKFFRILLRIMGLCFDPTKRIDVGGNAKVPDVEIIDDSFFDVTNQELRIIENKVDLTVNGLVTFEDCNNVNLPVNPNATANILNEIINENSKEKKIKSLLDGINNLSNDPKWKSLISPEVKIDGALLTELIKNLPSILVKSILSPKVMFGFLVMVKSISSNITLAYTNLTEFMKTFKKFVVNFMRRIFSIFIEEIFNIIKKNIKLLVESLLLDIINEAKTKRLRMYATIIYILTQLVNAFIDFRNCKSVIDEILKLLNLGLSNLNVGLPLFALAASDLLGGVSDTRAIANTILNLQKLGLPTGDNGDGSPNLMNFAMSSVIKGQNQEIAENGKVQVYIPPLSVTPGGTIPAKGVGKFI
jgi:hypothetical protein